MAAREATPPPIIGKAGRYTVFITPPTTPKPSEASRSHSPRPSPSPSPSPRPSIRNVAPTPAKEAGSPATTKPLEASRSYSPSPSPGPRPSVRNAVPCPVKEAGSPARPPPVQVPPPQFEKSGGKGSGSVFGFFWDAVAKVQDVHSSLDEYLADWFGLNQSKYQWALNDYYENKGAGKDDGKAKELVSKGQSV